MTGLKKRIQRHQRLMERMRMQQCWGAEYQPGMKATRAEAPSISRPARLAWEKVRRDIHAASQAQRIVSLLGMYHPKVFDIHEERVLPPLAAHHPLLGHPLAAGMTLLPLSGTVRVAERLGVLKSHPFFWYETEEGNWLRVAEAFLGDLLLFIQGDNDQPYCVNWYVKANEQGFKRRRVRTRIRSPEQEMADQRNAEIRYEIEKTLYADVGIRTVPIAADSIDQNLAASLFQLFLDHGQQPNLSQAQQEELTQRFEEDLARGSLPMHTIGRMMKKWHCEVEDCRIVLHQAIWYRRMRVDLFEPIMVDSPLQPERKDALVVYGDWFWGE